MIAMHMSSWLLEQFAVEVSAEVFLRAPLHDILHGHVLKTLLPDHETPSLKLKQVPSEIDWKKEMDISFLESEFGGRKVEMALPGAVTVLLTGTSGFVGRFVLWQLVQDPRCAKVYCLLRGKRKKNSACLLPCILYDLLGAT